MRNKKFLIGYTLVVLLLVGGLTFIGLTIKKNNVDNVMEKAFEDEADKYFNYYVGLIPKKGETKITTLKELVDSQYDPKLDKSCDGYVVTTAPNGVPKQKAYIKCDNYTSEKFDENNLKK